MIRIEHLKKSYPNVSPLKDVSVEIHDGDVSALKDPHIHAVCEYSEQTEVAECSICYNGERFDITSYDDYLVLSILKGVTESLSYTWMESSDYSNKLKLTLR